MGDESTFSYTRKDNHGDLFTVRGYSFEEFGQNLADAYGVEAANIIGGFQRIAPAQPPTIHAVPDARVEQAASVPQTATPPAATAPPGQTPGIGAVQPQACPQCGQGAVVPRNRKDGTGIFYGCNRFPECRYIRR